MAIGPVVCAWTRSELFACVRVRGLHGVMGMLNMIKNMILGQRRTGLGGLFNRSRQGGMLGGVRNNPKTSIIGALATVAAPMVLRKLLQQRKAAQQAQTAPAA